MVFNVRLLQCRGLPAPLCCNKRPYRLVSTAAPRQRQCAACWIPGDAFTRSSRNYARAAPDSAASRQNRMPRLTRRRRGYPARTVVRPLNWRHPVLLPESQPAIRQRSTRRRFRKNLNTGHTPADRRKVYAGCLLVDSGVNGLELTSARPAAQHPLPRHKRSIRFSHIFRAR